MKKLNLLTSLFSLSLISSLMARPVFAANAGDASEVNMKIYKMWVSPNTDCSEAVLVFDESNPSSVNMVSNPTLGSATVANGTYPCIAIKMSDLITGKPNYTSDGGNCTPSTNISIDVFRVDNSATSTCPDGTVITGTGTSGAGAQDNPCLFMSTTGNTSNTGWIASSPFPLSGAFVVSSDRVGTFVADFTGQILDEGTSCGIDPPAFGFR